MVPDKPGWWYHKDQGPVWVYAPNGNMDRLWMDLEEGSEYLVARTAPTDWLGPVPTAEEWAKAPDHSGAPNDMTRELAEALEGLLEYTTCVLHGEGCFNTTELNPYRAVLEKWRATRKDKP